MSFVYGHVFIVTLCMHGRHVIGKHKIFITLNFLSLLFDSHSYNVVTNLIQGNKNEFSKISSPLNCYQSRLVSIDKSENTLCAC